MTPEASTRRHCWLRLRRHHWRLERRNVYYRLISELYECRVCGELYLKFDRTLPFGW